MTISPQKFREIVFQLLYSDDFGGSAEVAEMLMAQLCITKKIVRQANEIKEKIVEKKKQIDELISNHSESYHFERIPRIERNVIRLSAYDLLFSPHLPPKVVIAEAIRLARKFSTPEAATFVNAVLDSIYKKVQPNADQPNAEQI
jgi:N utilization substance protein B